MTKKVFFLQGFPVAKVTCYVTIMTASCLSIIGVSFGTTIMLINYTALYTVVMYRSF